MSHTQDTWYGALNVYSTTAVGSIMPTYLWSETDYQICAYAENIYENWSAGSVYYFSTTTMDVNYYWEIKATSSTTTTNTSADTIRDIVSAQQGINPKRNVNAQVTQTTTGGRRLQTTTNEYTYSAVIAAARDSEVTTLSIATLSAEEQATVGTDMVAVLGTSFGVSGYTP